MVILQFIPQTDMKNTDMERYLSMLTEGLRRHAEVHCTHSFKEFRQAAKTTRPDIVHLHACWNITGYRVQHWTNSHLIPLVLSLHGQMLPWHLHKHYWTQKLPLLIGYQRHAICQAEALQVASGMEYQKMKDTNWTPRLALIKNPIITHDISPEELALQMMVLYNKVIDSNSFRLMTAAEKNAESTLLRVGLAEDDLSAQLSQQEIDLLKALTNDSWRKILIHAYDEETLDAVKKGAQKMQLHLKDTDVGSLDRFAQKLEKTTGELESTKTLTKNPITKNALDNIRSDEKPSETDMQGAMMLLNIDYEIRHRTLIRRHLNELYRFLRFQSYNEDKLVRMLNTLKLTDFTASLLQILSETLGLEEGFMPLDPAENQRTNQLRKTLLKTNVQ